MAAEESPSAPEAARREADFVGAEHRATAPPALFGSSWLYRARGFVAGYFTDAGKTAAKNLVGTTLFNFGSQIIGLASVVLLTNALGQSQYGIYAFALSILSYLLLLNQFGTNRIVLRELSQQRYSHEVVFTGQLAITLTLAIPSALLLICFAWFAAQSNAEACLLTAVAVGSIFASAHLMPFFDASHKQALAAFLAFVAQAAWLLAIAGLDGIGQLTLITVGAALAGRAILQIVMEWTTYMRRVRVLRWDWKPSFIPLLLKSGWPMLLTGLFATSPFAAGVLFVRALHGDDQAAIFGFAQQIAMAAMGVGAIAGRILHPHIVGPYGRTKSFVVKLAVFLALFGVALVVVTCGATFAVLHFLLPSAYGAAFGPCCLMLTAAMFQTMVAVLGMYFISLRRERVLLLVRLTSVCVYVLVAFLLAQSLPLYGPAMATLGSAIVATLLTLGILRSLSTNYADR